ncbi:MAG: hypothetical protein AAF529_14575 [Pseudomonadota bacterium]
MDAWDALAWAPDAWDAAAWGDLPLAVQRVTLIDAGAQLELVFNAPAAIGVGGATGFAVTLSGGAATVAYQSGANTNTWLFTLSRVMEQAETGTLQYTQPGDGVEDLAGDDLTSFTADIQVGLLQHGSTFYVHNNTQLVHQDVGFLHENKTFNHNR